MKKPKRKQAHEKMETLTTVSSKFLFYIIQLFQIKYKIKYMNQTFSKTFIAVKIVTESTVNKKMTKNSTKEVLVTTAQSFTSPQKNISGE